ncbi:MAG: ABC transporter permease [Desulfobacterales bacterium]|jgi:phospholipid/cholesterol/gamma-HCH transport system permease protein
MAATGKMQLQKTAEGSLTVALAGSWKLGQELPSADEVLHALEDMPAIGSIAFDTRELAEWDSGLLIFLKQLSEFSAHKKITVEESGLPEGARKLLALAAAVPAKKDARKAGEKVPFLAHVGNETVDFFKAAGDMLAFIGDTVIAFLNLLRGKAQFRKSDLGLIMEACGGQALPIVSLICFLVGLILAFIGAIQLQLFGAQIYVADLVGIAMVRLMAAIMTGIVMAGRTGGAFAAQLGTMQVNQEIDALKTLGISPMEFLVLPRMLALALMMPLLCLYANVMGILGGMVVGVGMLDIGLIQYYNQTAKAVNLWNLGIGIFSGIVFGVIVALSGCMRGMQCGRSASAVGGAATSAVVTAIVGIILSTAVITVICNLLGI